MKWKTTAVLLIAAVGLGSYVALVELKQPTQEERAERARQVVQIPPDEVTGLSVTFPAVTATLQRHDQAWRLSQPIAARADGSLLRRILNELDPLEAERVLEGGKDTPPALGEFGLASPRGTLAVTAGTRTTTLLFGEPTPVGDNLYLALPDSPKVFVVGTRLFEELNQPLETYRSRELLEFETWKVTRIAVASSRASYTLTKQGQRWQLTDPIADEADSAAASTTLSKLRNLPIERFMTDSPPAEPSPQWGFDAPFARITLTLEGAEQPLELAIGNTAVDDEQQRYARRSDEPTVYTVNHSSIEELLPDPQTLRSKMLMDFFADQVAKIHLAWQEAAWTIEKIDGQWNVSGGQEALDAAKVEEWLWRLRDTKLNRFLEDAPQDLAPARPELHGAGGRYGLEPPSGTIQVWVTDQPEPTQLLIGASVEPGKTRYGRVVGRAAVVELPETINDLLTATPESFHAQPEPPQSIQ